ncbi:hypothetical protein DPX16_3393 [Anabarilius grahami]|uniref:Uncharacterized protein n=1 Tax=Anabarilius grahami TaxID=495550 RepID=A0A3N0XP50_ANAGA|nr:hypothetical protein DPX16_3393 [Anabarilius grahami]
MRTTPNDVSHLTCLLSDRTCPRKNGRRVLLTSYKRDDTEIDGLQVLVTLVSTGLRSHGRCRGNNSHQPDGISVGAHGKDRPKDGLNGNSISLCEPSAEETKRREKRREKGFYGVCKLSCEDPRVTFPSRSADNIRGEVKLTQDLSSLTFLCRISARDFKADTSTCGEE